jgi:WbqC-like protein family
MTALVKSIVILQSNYIPWKGYFDLMQAADEFLIYDEVQFTKNDWRNRNRIVLDGRLQWLSIAVKTAGRFGLPIEQVDIADPAWAQAHWATITQAYRRAECFDEVTSRLADLYQAAGKLLRLTDINELLLRGIAELLQIDTTILRTDIVPRGTDDPTARLVEICKARGATRYISGPAAKAYLSPAAFDQAGIELRFADYSGYVEYQQNLHPFVHGVSMLDLLFHFGSAARTYLKTSQKNAVFLVSS